MKFTYKHFFLLSSLFFVLLISIGIYKKVTNVNSETAIQKNLDENRKEEEIITDYVEPEPYIKDIGTGIKTATFSHGDDVIGPKLQTVILDPIDPEINGDPQNIIATIKHDSDVTSAKVIVYTDENEISKALELIKGTLTDGTWEVKIPYTDSYLKTYYIKFFLESETGDFEGGLRLR